MLSARGGDGAPQKGGSEPLRAGVAIRAKVSNEVGSEIREQIKAQATAVLKNFGQVVKDGKLFVHPGVKTTLAET